MTKLSVAKLEVMTKRSEEDVLMMAMSCLLAIVGVILLRMVVKLDFQAWSLVYFATAATAAIRRTPAGTSLSIGSVLRAVVCLMIGVFMVRLAGYSGVPSLQASALLPAEVMEALSHFHIYYDN